MQKPAMFVNVNTFQMNYVYKKRGKIFFKHIFSETEVDRPQMRDVFKEKVKSCN